MKNKRKLYSTFDDPHASLMFFLSLCLPIDLRFHK